MRSYRTPVLMLCALALAACQPSQAPAQTQAAQSAFDTAVAAAGTQAGPTATRFPTRTPLPTYTPTATLVPTRTPRPLTTESAEGLQTMSLNFESYLERKIASYRPPDGKPYDAHIWHVEFQYYAGGTAAVMDVSIRKSDETSEAPVQAAMLNTFVDMYEEPNRLLPLPNDMDDQLMGAYLPDQLSVFRVHIFDLANKERFRLSGNWPDVIAYAKGSLTKDEFIGRLKFESAVE